MRASGGPRRWPRGGLAGDGRDYPGVVSGGPADLERSSGVRRGTRSLAVALGLAAGLAGTPALAGGVYEYFGIGGVSGPAVPSCPGTPCEVVTETTGFQASIKGRHSSSVVGRAGLVTSWRIALSTPTAAEIAYFDKSTGAPPSAGLVVLRHTTGYHFRVVGASPIALLAPLFGRTTSFALKPKLRVRSGDILALSVPTWAPTLAVGLDAGTAWRSSRATGTCASLFSQTAVISMGAVTTSECVYATARLAYGVTVSVG